MSKFKPTWASYWNEVASLSLEDRELMRRDVRVFMRRLCLIQDERMQMRPLKMNEAQALLLRTKVETARASRPLRFLILKPRKLGITTFEQGTSFWACATRPGFRALTLADNARNTRIIFEIARRFVNSHPAWKGNPEVSETGEGIRIHHAATNGPESLFAIATAGAKTAGRGGDIHRLHGSEVAHWEDGETVSAALLGALPDGAEVVYETTANGTGNYFHNLWTGAKEGRNDFVPVFFPWWRFRKYRAATLGSHENQRTDPWEIVKDLGPVEIELCRRYSLCAQQILWWRAKKRELGDRMDQEFPSDDVTCFLASRLSPFFTLDQIRLLSAACAKPLREVRHPIGVERVWREPDQRRKYVCGGDVAEGVEGGDYSCLGVLDWESGEQVAALHGRWPPHEFAVHAARLAWEYGKAVLAIEANNHGFAVLDSLSRELKYPNLWYSDKAKAGWVTNAQTRPVLVDETISAVRESAIRVNDEVFVSECSTLWRYPNGKIEASEGKHDDCFFAWGIAWQVRKLLAGSSVRLSRSAWA